MRVFVLCTGRCGSTTFTYACEHMENFTSGHETRAKFIGPERVRYPDNHIEVDNRLSWCLGRLDQAYGDEPYFVHLTREPGEVAVSYAKRMSNPASIGAAHKRSILMNTPHDDLEVCVDVVETMLANINAFLGNKKNVMRISLENIEDDFTKFWHWIGAEGDLASALAEWKTLYNSSETAHGAIHPEMPRTELAELREENKKLGKAVRQLEQKAAEESDELEQAHRMGNEAAAKLKIAEQRCVDLESRVAKMELLWKEKAERLQQQLNERDRAVCALREGLEASTRRLNAEIGEVAGQRDAFIDYADELEYRFRHVLASRTWKAFGPYRLFMRKVRGLLAGSPVPPNVLPKRPDLEAAKRRAGRRLPKRITKAIPHVRRLDKRLWGGFSRSALLELRDFEDDVQKPAKDRAEAAYYLARWHSVQGDFAQALERITSMRGLVPELAHEPRQYLPEALFLCRLGRAEEARSLLESMSSEFDPTVQLMLANTWNSEVAGISVPEAESRVLDHLNSIYERFGLHRVEKRDSGAPLSIDNLQGAWIPGERSKQSDKVTVIIPVFNAEDTIATALTSVAEQTWRNLEVLVVDDASSDNSVNVIKEFCSADSRFQIIRQAQNSGSYIGRNRALRCATGDFVTIHDSDDWSHPQKIECQLRDLKERPAPYNLAMWVRTTTSLSFFGNSRTLHDLVRPDHSSGLFPKSTFDTFGAWDAVRISADTELYWRIESALKNKKWMFNRRQVLKGCPMSFGRMSSTSLTQSGPTSVMTIYHGLRREYRDAADFWHSRQEKVVDPSPDARRTPFFPVPPLMDATTVTRTEFGTLLIADWNASPKLLEEAIRRMPLLSTPAADGAIGLLHYPRYHSNVSAPLNHETRGFAWDNSIRIVSPGEVVCARTVVVVMPEIFEHVLDRFPVIEHDRVVVVTRLEESLAVSGEDREYDHRRVEAHLQELFSSRVEWVDSLEDVEPLLGQDVEAVGLAKRAAPAAAR